MSRFLVFLFINIFIFILIFLHGIFILIPHGEAGVDELSRYKMIEDRLMTQEELRPFGHDFIIDISAALSKELLTIIDEGEKAAKTEGTDQEKVQAIADFLNKYDKTEQFGWAKVSLGIPLPSFTFFGARIVPDLRGHGSLGSLLSLKVRELNGLTIPLSDIPGVPAELITLIGPSFTIPVDLTPGTDLVQYAVNEGAIPAALAAPYLGQYLMPDVSLPNINLYIKNDFRISLNLQFFLRNKFFGHLNFYNLIRRDKEVTISEQMLKTNPKIADLKNNNSQSTLQMDFRLGYQNENFSAFVAMEEKFLKKFKDRVSSDGDVVYQYTPLYRLHADYLYRLWILKLSPFVGLHKRDAYSYKQGFYGGLETALTVWGDRFFLSFTTTFDDEYITYTPRLRFWIIQAEYSYRRVKETLTTHGMKTSNIHSGNIRLFF